MKNMIKWFLSRYHKKASILVLSIWILMFFSILSVGLYRIISSRLNLARAIEERTIGFYVAKAACLYAQVEHENTKLSYDSFYELAKESKKKLGMSEFTYTKTDEESKLNINTSAVEMIARLPGLNLNLAQNINASSLKPFKAKEELLLVEGITEEIYTGIKDFITVYTDGKININTASGEVLKALGLDDGLVNLIKDYRRGADYQENTADDKVFENIAEILDKLRAYGSLSGAQEAALVSLVSQGILVVSSKNLDLKIETKIRGKAGMKYGIILDKDRIKEWREY